MHLINNVKANISMKGLQPLVEYIDFIQEKIRPWCRAPDDTFTWDNTKKKINFTNSVKCSYTILN